MRYKRILIALIAWLALGSFRLLADEWIDTDGDGQNDTVQMDPFIVDGNDPDTFDWEGYWEWLDGNNIDPEDYPDPSAYWSEVTGGSNSGATGALGTYATNNTYPYNQTTNTSCAVATARNLIVALKGGSAPGEGTLASRMAAVVGDSTTFRFQEAVEPHDGAHGASKIKAQLNAALNPEGLVVGNAQYYGNQQFTALMQDAANNGTAFAAKVVADGTISLEGNHVVVFRPYNDNGTLKVDVIDSGKNNNGNATVTTYSGSGELNELAEKPIGGTNSNGEPYSGNIYSVTPKPGGP